jgi:holo-[acyl-carrier protein] synthase
MIVGLGTDIVQHSRIQRVLDENLSKCQRYFTPNEIAVCGIKVEKYASRHAAKEAAVKALGTGFRDGIVAKDVEVVNDELGKPSIIFHGKARERAMRLKVGVPDNLDQGVHLSLSHEREYSCATVILESFY